MFEIARDLVEKATGSGCEYAEARVVQQRQQVISCVDGSASVRESSTEGFGLRVLVNGRWGFASVNLGHPNGVDIVVEEAMNLARARPARARQISMAQAASTQGSYQTPCERDPFQMPLAEKIDFVQAITGTIQSHGKAVSRSLAQLDFRGESSHLVTSTGTDIEQRLNVSGIVVSVVVEKDGQTFRRNYPERAGDYGTGGFEYILGLKPLEVAAQMVPEALDLLKAPTCEAGQTTVILDSTMLGHVLHETIGHPSELDRALGDESDNFGPSFLRPALRGNLQYGSELVTIYADATRPGAAATYGFDHEGVAAQKVPLVENGVFQNYHMSRECAADLGMTSNGTARASSWNRIPMVRITNLCLAPGTSTKEQLISETDDGLFIDTVKGSDIDDKRLSFSFVGERGWKIRKGKIVGLVKNPVIYAETPMFWSSCTGIAGPAEDRIPGIAGCGKGLPWQFVVTGQGGPPARFENVKVGAA